MKITDYCDCLNIELKIVYLPNKDWRVTMKGVSIKEGEMSKSTFGQGSIPSEAVKDYIKEIEGKRIMVKHSGEKEYLEYDVPEYLKY